VGMTAQHVVREYIHPCLPLVPVRQSLMLVLKGAPAKLDADDQKTRYIALFV
jgi:hypothetical protein